MRPSLFTLLLCIFCMQAIPSAGQADDPKADSIERMSVEFWTRNRLIIVPVMINDTLKVNLAIDPHCRSIVLFGKRFSRLLKETRVASNTSALSASRDTYDISVGPMRKEAVPILVVPNTDLLNFFTSVNGVIGMQYFAGYELIMNRRMQTLTLKPSDESLSQTARISYPGSIYDKMIFH